MADRNLRSLGWSVACYYATIVLLVFVAQVLSQGAEAVGEAIRSSLGAPLVMILLFFTSLSVANPWISLPIVVGVLVGLCVAVVRLRGKWRIGAVIALLTIVNLYALYVGSLVGA